MSDCSEVSTSSSCTGARSARCAAVAVVQHGAPGVPGRRSTKKLPSRKMRGRIFAVGVDVDGSPWSSISITTRAARAARGLDATTLPTFTPAIRTGEPSRSEWPR